MKKNVSVIGRCSIPLPRITVPDTEAEKQDDIPKKVAPAVLDGHSKPCVHTVGGVVLGVSLDDKKSEVDVQFQFPKDYERYFRLIRCLTTMVSTSSPAICLTVWMGTTCSWPLGPTPTWRGRGYQMRITLPQFLPLSAPVGLRPNHRSVYLYDRCCACFKCWLQVQCQAQTRL